MNSQAASAVVDVKGENERRPTSPVTLEPVRNPCAICGGDRIGSELNYRTCGHCGGRFLRPEANR